MKKKGRVVAVPDPRTASSTGGARRAAFYAKSGETIAQLDASPAKKEAARVYDLQNAYLAGRQPGYEDLFQRSGKYPRANNNNTRTSLLGRRPLT